MPPLDTKLHLNMYHRWKASGNLQRIKKAIRVLLARDSVYGLQWGDPEVSPPLGYVRDHFLRPYVSPVSTIVEIGPGGGRWTRYMLDARRIYAVDYHQELLDELASTFQSEGIVFIKNNGSDFPGVPERSIDFIFSFGAFVHMDIDVIDRYLQSMRPLLKPESNVVIQYSDKTKPMAKMVKGFSDNDPERMRTLVRSHGYDILEEDTATMWHSSIVRFSL